MLDARLVRVILKASCHLLTPRHYDQFLKQAGLERFKQPPTDLENEPGAPVENMAIFIHCIVDKIGIEASRLFFANVAYEVSQTIIKRPYAVTLKKELAELNPDERYDRAVEKFIEWSNARGSKFDLQQNNSREVWQLISTNCFYCSGVHYNEPFCDVITVNLKNVISFLANQPIRAEEVTCRARGDSQCVFEIREALN